MTQAIRPEVTQDQLNQKVGSDMPEREPLDLLPEREWLNAHIQSVAFQVAMFNNQVQYVTYKDENDQDVAVLGEDGEKIMRKEFEFIFIFDDYDMPQGNGKRKAWLRLGASFGEKSHLPKFLVKVLPEGLNVETPQQIIDAVRGKAVQLQLKNVEAKDGSKTYQNVVWDAVRAIEPGPQVEQEPPEISRDPPPPAENVCSCTQRQGGIKPDPQNPDIQICNDCDLPLTQWDE